MKIARFNGGRIGVVFDDRIVDVSAACGADPAEWPPVGINRTIAEFAKRRFAIAAAASTGSSQALSDVRLETPIPWPQKLLAVPKNFGKRSARDDADSEDLDPRKHVRVLTKPNASLSGPGDPIIVPEGDEQHSYHECELATIIGVGGRDISAQRALDYVFGYTCLIDIKTKKDGTRTMRKSFDAQTPIGPWITTRDEVGPPDDLHLRLFVNGELRQHAGADQMRIGVRQQIALCSSIVRLEPGDIIASGTVTGTSALAPGDRIEIAIERVGHMELSVLSAAQARRAKSPLS